MSFFTLLKKELRECLPWAVLTAAFLLIVGNLLLSDWAEIDLEYRYQTFERYSDIWGKNLVKHPPVGDVSALLFVSAVGLGLALGVRQFWLDDFTRTWCFILHRSTSRSATLSAKICATLISFVAAIGIAWSYLNWRASLPDYSPVPVPQRYLTEGWLISSVGLLAYLGAALAGLSKARWYTTKLMGLGFALWMFVTLIIQWQFVWGLATVAIGTVVLLYLIWETFLNREF